MRRTPNRTSRRGSDTRVRDASLSVRSDAIEMLAVEVEVVVVALLLGARPARCGLGTSECARQRWTTTTTRARGRADQQAREINFTHHQMPAGTPSVTVLRSRAQCRARVVLDGPTARASFSSSAKMRVYVIRHAQSANNALRASPLPSLPD